MGYGFLRIVISHMYITSSSITNLGHLSQRGEYEEIDLSLLNRAFDIKCVMWINSVCEHEKHYHSQL